MGKIHPIFSSSSSSSAATAGTSPDVTSTTETFTVWMKSLVMNGNGCTIYDGGGAVVYRVDNYQKKGGSEVCLMDLNGNLVFTILKKGSTSSLLCSRLRLFTTKKWKGYRCDEETAAFCVVRKRSSFTRELCCEVVVSCGGGRYRMEASRPAGKKVITTAFRITEVGVGGGVVAEAKRKRSGSDEEGVLLGDDVLTLVVRPGVGRSLVMALATVYGLMSRRL